MKTKDFLKQHSACIEGAKWALSMSNDMADVWDAMIKQGKYNWLIWTLSRAGVFPDSVLRKMACKFIRKTPLSDGRTVWDMLTDERSRRAVEIAEAYADGKATDEELKSANAAARAAGYAANAADRAAAYAAYAAYAAAYVTYAADAAYDAGSAAYAAADAAADLADAAYTAADAAYVDARASADAAYVDTRASADAAYAVAKAAQVQMIAEMGNPFKERVKQ